MNGSTRLRFLAALLFGFIALPGAGQVNDTYVVPAIGNAPGAFGTRWMTQLSIFNPQLDYSLKVSVVFLPNGGGKGLEALLTVPPNGTWYTDNALDDIFGLAGMGSLLVATFPEDNPGVPNDVLSRSFHVTTNTYNNSPAGTFGQTVPGIWTGLQDFQSDGISAVAHGIRHIARLGWRTNIGAVNLGRTSVTMRVTIYDENGRTVAKNLPFIVPPLGHIQDRLPVEVDRGSLEFFIDDPTRQAVVFPYSSTIDQYSGDPTYQSPTLLASAKVLYSKGKVEGKVQPTVLGKKIDINFARGIRATTMRIGEIAARRR